MSPSLVFLRSTISPAGGAEHREAGVWRRLTGVLQPQPRRTPLGFYPAPILRPTPTPSRRRCNVFVIHRQSFLRQVLRHQRRTESCVALLFISRQRQRPQRGRLAPRTGWPPQPMHQTRSPSACTAARCACSGGSPPPPIRPPAPMSVPAL